MIRKTILICMFSCVIATLASQDPPDFEPLAVATADDEQRWKRAAIGSIEYILYCKDQHPSCSGWAQRGECTINPIYMNLNCQDSCKVCHVGDKSLYCGWWARRGECFTNPSFIIKHCVPSCFKYGMCQKSSDDRVQKFPHDVVNRKPERRNYSQDPPDVAPLAVATADDEQRLKRTIGSIQYTLYCKDQNIHCLAWAQRGECAISPIYMNLYCQDSCKVCHVGDKSLYCGYFARRGECTKDPAFMGPNCVPSCSRYASSKRSSDNRFEKFFLDVINRKRE